LSHHITDPYAVLGVAPGATPREVRAGYRRLAKRYHPDLHGDSGDAAQMRRINEAWGMLSRREDRRHYGAAARRDRAAAPRRGARPVGAPSGAWAAGPARDGWTAPVGGRGGAAAVPQMGARAAAMLLLALPLAAFGLTVIFGGFLPVLPLLLLAFLVISIAGRALGEN
jgi:molecular chaperone DnaJ